ncbi:putative holin [Mycolicibacterium fallax]|uniref:Hydrophobic protein n=1 Tax=Mycolicibacterium fallax TaxID=1793 RepID=A0A1X1RD32_MYCFA|nr:putative holin [Mycolicibacterium fallax]ORV03242.1 hypothetical protein AWC04_11205 [Mycolicibacterium fallax]HOW94766.1 putative holin [Mycolicibacterium fallax]
MIPLPRAPILTAVMLLGLAAGVLAGVLGAVLVESPVRPDLVMGLVLGVPSVLGVLTVLVAGRRWVTATGAFLVSVAPGWFAVLVLAQVVNGAG